VTVESSVRHEDLFHTGVVVADVAAAEEELGELLGLTWLESEGEAPMLLEDGPRTVAMKVAYSEQGPHRLELIQSVPGTVWVVPGHGHPHHLGYWTDDVAAATGFLLSKGLPRVVNLGTVRDDEFPTGVYHRARNGIYIEVLSRALEPFLFGPESVLRKRS
jgi:hypothetical protein